MRLGQREMHLVPWRVPSRQRDVNMSGTKVTLVLLRIRSRRRGRETMQLLRSWPSYITLCRKKGYKYEETHGASDPVMSAVSAAGDASSTVAHSVPGTGCRREETLDDLAFQPRVVPEGRGRERSHEDMTPVTDDDEGPCGEERDDATYGHTLPEITLPRSWRARMPFTPRVWTAWTQRIAPRPLLGH